MADFSAKQFQELNEAYVSMYRTEEVVEEVAEEIVEATQEEIVEATQEEVVEETQEVLEGRATGPQRRSRYRQRLQDKADVKATEVAAGGGQAAIDNKLKDRYGGRMPSSRQLARHSSAGSAQRSVAATGRENLYRAGGGDAAMRDKGQTRDQVMAQGVKNFKAKQATPTPAPTPAPTPKPTPAPEPKAEVQTREIKKPSDGAERRTPTMAELRAAQAARAAGKSEKDVVKAGIAAGKPKVSARPLPTPPPPVKKSRLDTALSGIGKFKEAYDVVLEYLLSGGHAETVEEAHYVMLEMDQNTIKNICEGTQEG